MTVPARMPRWLLRLEGLGLLTGSLVLYFHEDFGWVLLVVLALAPDVSIGGYLAGPRVGALVYDAFHTTAGPIALGVAGVLSGSDLTSQLALIWLAHVGGDRLLGYGLKYPTRFQDTHLQRV